MAGGNFTANLNSNGLKLNVKNYKLKNNNINLDLYDAASSYENIDYTTSEENINTNLNTNDFDFGESISKASNQLQEIKSTQEEEKPWWDVVFDYAATAVGSVVSGVVDVVENIGDGLIMCGGELASGVASLCGNEDLASEIKKGTQDIVQYDWSEAAYDAAMDALDVDDEIAHGVVHQVGNAVGSMAGYAALSLVPGGAAVTAATGFLAAKGSSAEHAFQSGATFEEASVTSTVAGAAGALSGAALNKVQGAAKGASSIKDVAKLTAKGMAVSAAEPVVNSVTEYATYGKDMVDENGNPLYDNFGDYYVESGGLLNTAIAGGVGGISAGSQATSGYRNNINTQKNRVDNLEKISNKMEASTFDRIKNKAFLKNQGKYSDEAAFKLYKLSIEDAIGKAKQAGNKDVQNMLEKLYLLKNKRPGFGIYFDPDNGAFSDSYISGSISLGTDVISGNQKGVVYHELGHTLHGAINDSLVPSNYMNVKESIKSHMFHNTDVVRDCMNYIQDSASSAYNQAAVYFDENMASSVVNQLNQANWDDVINNYKKAGFSEQQINELIQIDYNEQYNNIRNAEIIKLSNNYQREQGVDALSDIVGSVWNGNKRFAILDKNGNKVYLGGDITYSHDINYYTKITDQNGNIIGNKTLEEVNECAFHEQMANYIQLKLSNDTVHLNMLQKLLGDDWIQMMEKEFNNILDYFK